MYNQFGQKWSRLQQGPMWNVAFSAQASKGGEGIPSDGEPNNSCNRSTMKVRNYVNHVGEALLLSFLLCRPWLTFLPFQTGHYVEILPPVLYTLVLRSEYVCFQL